MKFSGIYCAAATLGMVSAHSIMQRVTVGSTTHAQGEGIFMPSFNGFVDDLTSASLACNGAPNSGFKSSSAKLSVKAGETVSGAWLHTLSTTGADSSADNKIIDSSHKGPVIAWMKKVSDATQNPSAGPGDGWFKVAEAGLISPNQWAVDALISAGGVQSVQIPSCIEDGDYLLRFELIALHSAYSSGGAQFYMECAQITVSGGTGGSKPSTVAIPGVYSAADPGILINIYNNQGQPYPSSGKYTIPGPPVFSCGATNAPAGNSSIIPPPAGGSAASSPANSPTTSARTTFSTSYKPTAATTSAKPTFATSYKPTVATTAAPANTSEASECSE